eukprot:gene55231-37481_t
MACSDPHRALAWAIDHLPVIDCRSPDGGECNATWACAAVGRSNLCWDDACSPVDPTPRNGTQPSLMFPHL